MKVHTDPLVDDYLRRLDAAASGLPADQRDELVSEIRDHLQEALRQAPAGDQAAVRNALERLGSPEEIAAAAADPPPGQPAGAASQINGLAIASVLANDEIYRCCFERAPAMTAYFSWERAAGATGPRVS